MDSETVECVACAIYDALEADKDIIYLGRFGDGDAVVIDGYVNLLVCAEAAIKAHNKV